MDAVAFPIAEMLLPQETFSHIVQKRWKRIDENIGPML